MISALEQNSKHRDQFSFFEVDRIYLQAVTPSDPATGDSRSASAFCDERYQSAYLCYDKEKRPILKRLSFASALP